MSEEMSPIDYMRRRPGMYIGPLEKGVGVAQMVFELTANAVDLFLAGKATRVSVAARADGVIEVSDDGPGLPFDVEAGNVSLAERCLCLGHRTPTADGHTPHVHISNVGCGMIVANALSEWMEVTSIRGGIQYQQRFERGVPLAAPARSATTLPSGTTFRFFPDGEVFGEHSEINHSLVRSRLFSAAHLFPGLKIQCGEEVFLSKRGLADMIDVLVSAESHFTSTETITVRETSDFCQVNFACGGRAEDGEPPWVCSWANGVFTNQGGDHVKGMGRAIKKLREKPSVAMISVILDGPNFAGPTRSKLISPEVRRAVKKLLTDQFKARGLTG